jgi:hypothetical protein
MESTLKSIQSIKQSFIWHGLQIIVFASLLMNPDAFPYWLQYIFYFFIIGLVISFYRKIAANENTPSEASSL